MSIQESAQEKVARIKAELEAKRNTPKAPPPAAPAVVVAAPVVAAPLPAVVAAPVAVAAIPPMPAIAGMTQVVWDLMGESTRTAILAAAGPAPAVAPAPAAPPMYEQQTAPINPPDMLGGTVAPVPAETPPAPLPTPEPAKRTRTAKPAAEPVAADNATTERIAVALETIAGLLEVIALK